MCAGLALVGVCLLNMQSAATTVESGPPAAPAIIPQPAQIETLAGSFLIAPSTVILVEPDRPDVSQVGAYLAERIYRGTAWRLPIRQTRASWPMPTNSWQR